MTLLLVIILGVGSIVWLARKAPATPKNQAASQLFTSELNQPQASTNQSTTLNPQSIGTLPPTIQPKTANGGIIHQNGIASSAPAPETKGISKNPAVGINAQINERLALLKTRLEQLKATYAQQDATLAETSAQLNLIKNDLVTLLQQSVENKNIVVLVATLRVRTVQSQALTNTIQQERARDMDILRNLGGRLDNLRTVLMSWQNVQQPLHGAA